MSIECSGNQSIPDIFDAGVSQPKLRQTPSFLIARKSANVLFVFSRTRANVVFASSDMPPRTESTTLIFDDHVSSIGLFI